MHQIIPDFEHEQWRFGNISLFFSKEEVMGLLSAQFWYVNESTKTHDVLF